MAVTYLQLVNTLLKRVREDEVTSVSDNDYSLLLGEFVNLAKEELESRHNWARLRLTSRILTSEGVWAYELDSIGDNYEIQFVWDDTNDQELVYRPYIDMSRWLNENDAENKPGFPTWYDINGYVGDNAVINLYPIPNGRYYINVDAVVAQSELTADTDELIIPKRPVIETAMVHVLEERGEDDGDRYARQVQRAEEMAIRYMTQDTHKWEETSIWTTNDLPTSTWQA